jgi:hypothetical protein
VNKATFDAWKVLGANISDLTDKMLSLEAGQTADIYYDPDTMRVSVGAPDGANNVKIAVMSSPDLDRYYDIRKEGNYYVDGDGQKFSRDEFPRILARMIKGMKDGGAEWGWEFKLCH